MNISLAIILGLTGAISWGAADFAARFASRQVGAYRTLFFMQFFGFLALTVYLKSTGGFSHGIAPGWQPWGMAVAAGLLNMLASLALYHSFEHGTLSIVGPVSSSYPALTVALSLLSGERIHAVRAAGLAVTLLGVILAATSFAQSKDTETQTRPEHAAAAHTEQQRAHLSTGVGWAICAALGFGVLFWFLGFHVVPAVGSAVSVWVMRLTALVALSLAAAPTGQSLKLPQRKSLVAAPSRRHPRYCRIRRQQRRPKHRPGIGRQRPSLALRRFHGPASVDLPPRASRTLPMARHSPDLHRHRPRQHLKRPSGSIGDLACAESLASIHATPQKTTTLKSLRNPPRTPNPRRTLLHY